MHEYKAPFTDMQFVLRELVDHKLLVPAARVRGCVARACRGGARGGCQVRRRRALAAQSPRGREGVRWHDTEVCTAAGWKEAYGAIRRGRLECAVLPARIRRTEPPARTFGAGRGDVERREHGLHALSDADARRDRGHRAARFGAPETDLSAEDGLGRMDRNDESHRAAGGLGSRRGAHARGASRRRAATRSRARRSSSPTASTTSPRTSFTWCSPGRPARREGVKGMSLFLVPKFMVNPDGSLGERNDVRCASVEHKLGIHGSPTCVLAYGQNGGAIGELVGEENRGLEYMFVMMNAARFAVGLEGVGLSERAFQAALQFANERIQGTAAGAKEPRAHRAPPGCAPHAHADEIEDRGDARARRRGRRVPGRRAPASRRRSAPAPIRRSRI